MARNFSLTANKAVIWKRWRGRSESKRPPELEAIHGIKGSLNPQAVNAERDLDSWHCSIRVRHCRMHGNPLQLQ